MPVIEQHVTATWRGIATLERETCDEMYRLMVQYFSNVKRDVFNKDLAEKDGVIELRDGRGKLCGFSTQVVYSLVVQGQECDVLFSGDTIVDREHWRQTALMQGWGKLALELMRRGRSAPLYWFLICGGYRTYRFLPLFFKSFWPAPGVDMPNASRALIDAMAAARFGHRYERSTGIIRADDDTYRLKPDVSEVTQARMRNPAVRHFQALNPGHAHGDELCCVAPLALENFTPAGLRMLGMRERNPPSR